MFGLMKQSGAAPKNVSKEFGRMHYCGVCKAMGTLYGQSARMFLNHDTVFLAELFSRLSGESTHLSDWDDSLQSINCLILPKADQIPASLRFAADVNVLLGCIKIQDNQTDGSRLWGIARRWYSPFHDQARERLATGGLDLEKIEGWLAELNELETTPPAQSGTMQEQLHAYAAPIARLTGYIFAAGAKPLPIVVPARHLQELGEALGRMVYLLDAWEDLEKDERKGEFNPLIQLGEAYDEPAFKAMLWAEAGRFRAALNEMGLAPEEVASYAGRLEARLPDAPAGCACTVEAGSCESPKKRLGLTDRSRLLRNLSESWNAPGFAPQMPKWKTALGFGTAAGVALVAPSLLETAGQLFRDVDPDWSTSIDDLTNNSELAPQLRNNCACCNNSGGCNCGKGCDDTCSTLFTVIIIFVVLLSIGVIIGIVFLVRALSRKKSEPVPAPRQGAQAAAPPQSFQFRKVVEMPGKGITELTHIVNAWLEGKDLLAQSKVVRDDPDRRVIQLVHEIPFKAKINDASAHLGTVSFELNIHIIDDKFALVFDDFQHHASNDIPEGGSLNNIRPQNYSKIMTDNTWAKIKHLTSAHIDKMLQTI